MAIKGGDFSGGRGTGSSGGARTRADIVAPPTQTQTDAQSGGLASLFETPEYQEAMANLGPPSNLQDAIDIAEYAFGQNLPEEFKMLQTRLGAAQTDPTQLQGLGQGITNFGLAANEQLTQAQQEGAMIPAQLNVLQEALKKKSGVGNQPIGTSETFDKLGVTGIGALTQSLNSRVTEMNAKYTSFSNVIKQVADAQVGISNAAIASANGALNEYSLLMDEYRYQQDRFDKMEQYERELADQLDLYIKKSEIDYQYESKLMQQKAAQGSGNIIYDMLTGAGSASFEINGGTFDNAAVPGVGMQVDSALGGGVITGYGSELWGPGLDVVLQGGKGADIVIPFDFEVIETGVNGGFGNQVKIKRIEDGQEIWLSHLDSIDIDPNASYIGGTKIGTQGNSGSTYSLSGGDGTHVDITMPKLDGSGYHTAQEVASYMGFNSGQMVDESALMDFYKAAMQSEIKMSDELMNIAAMEFLKTGDLATVVNDYFTDHSPDATKKRYEQAVGTGIQMILNDEATIEEVVNGISSAEATFATMDILKTIRESGQIPEKDLWEYELITDLKDVYEASTAKGGLKYKLGDAVTDFGRNLFTSNTEPTTIDAVLKHYFNGTMKKSYRLPITNAELDMFLNGTPLPNGERLPDGFYEKYPKWANKTNELIDDIFMITNK